MPQQICCIHQSHAAAQVALEAELRGLDLQANALRKQHDRLVQDKLSSTSKLAQLKDSLKVRAHHQLLLLLLYVSCWQETSRGKQILLHLQDLHCDSQLVFSESPGSRLVKQLQQKLTAALAKHDAAQVTCHTSEETAQQLQEHRQTHESQVSNLLLALSALFVQHCTGLSAALLALILLLSGKTHNLT